MREVSGRPLLRASHVESDGTLQCRGGDETGKVAHRIGPHGRDVRAGPVLRLTDGDADRSVDADLGQLPGGGVHGVAVTEQYDSGAGWQQPREVGDERPARLDVDAAAQMRTGEGATVPDINQPVPGAA